MLVSIFQRFIELVPVAPLQGRVAGHEERVCGIDTEQLHILLINRFNLCFQSGDSFLDWLGAAAERIPACPTAVVRSQLLSLREQTSDSDMPALLEVPELLLFGDRPVFGISTVVTSACPGSGGSQQLNTPTTAVDEIIVG